MVIDESKTEVKHILPNRFAEKTWKLLVDDNVDINTQRKEATEIFEYEKIDGKYKNQIKICLSDR